MGKLTTTNKKEALKTGKVYLDEGFYLNVPKGNIIPRRCKYCKSILPPNPMYTYAQESIYCNRWCYEIDNPPIIKHVCNKCGEIVHPMLRINRYGGKEKIHSSGVYPKYCDKHKQIRKLKKIYEI